MKGVLLCGGIGTRLRPLTNVTNKHLLPVYNRPMVEYPLRTLISMGCDDILVVTGGEHVGDFAAYLGDGLDYKVNLTYKVQREAGGIAQALACADGFIKSNEVFPVILGDNYFEYPPVINPNHPAIFVKDVPDAARFGVYKDGEIFEKPKDVERGLAVTGCYVYDYKVFKFIRGLKPSERGEVEITDVNNWCLRRYMEVFEYKGYWSDMGTFNSLLEVATLERGRK